MAQWSRALTTSRYVFLFIFFQLFGALFVIAFATINFFFIIQPTVITVVGLFFLETALLCQGQAKKKWILPRDPLFHTACLKLS